MKTKQVTAWSSCLMVLACLVAFSACSSTRGALTGETAFVASEKAVLRSSTAVAARSVGELKSGDQVTITERKSEGNTAWAHVSGPGGVAGWMESKALVKQEIVSAAQKIAEQIRNVPTQAVGKSKARLKLRLTPDRTSDDNVAYELSAGTVLDIVARERKPRPDKPETHSAQAGTATPSATPAGPKYDDWYEVRLKNLTIIPAGWIYGGSVDLDVPGDIAFFASAGQRITGWQSIGSTKDEQNQTKEHYLVAEKQLFGSDDQLDFNRLKILSFDPKRREYVTPFRDEVRGRFPILTKVEGNRGSFQITAIGKDGQSHPIDYTFEFVESGRPKVVRVTPKEGGRKR